jgi:hypothetical protein
MLFILNILKENQFDIGLADAEKYTYESMYVI